jgi:hypothetical protein
MKHQDYKEKKNLLRENRMKSCGDEDKKMEDKIEDVQDVSQAEIIVIDDTSKDEAKEGPQDQEVIIIDDSSHDGSDEPMNNFWSGLMFIATRETGTTGPL